jgi:hypothetical protein
MNVRLGSATTIPLADCGEILAVADVAAADSPGFGLLPMVLPALFSSKRLSPR